MVYPVISGAEIPLNDTEYFIDENGLEKLVDTHKKTYTVVGCLLYTSIVCCALAAIPATTIIKAHESIIPIIVTIVMKIILDVLETTGITATAGIGTNLFLCKVAMDIVAKHIPADKNGVRIAATSYASH